MEDWKPRISAAFFVPARIRFQAGRALRAGEGCGMRGKNRARRLILSSGLPEDALCDRARVTMTGQSAVLIEGQHGVVELASGQIRLKTGSGILTVMGEKLRLQELSLDAAMIAGEKIVTVSYGRP